MNSVIEAQHDFLLVSSEINIQVLFIVQPTRPIRKKDDLFEEILVEETWQRANNRKRKDLLLEAFNNQFK